MNRLKRRILQLDVTGFDDPMSLVRYLEEVGREQIMVTFANTNLLHHVARAPTLGAALKEFLIVNDGLGTDVASLVLHGSRFPSNLNGTDFIPAFFRHAKEGLRIFLFGAAPGVAQCAADALSLEFPQHAFVGTHDGFVAPADMAALIEEIRICGADTLLVAMGNPLQEQWVAAHAASLPCRYILCVGAFLDFASGRIIRAPVWLRRLRLEWLYRLMLEPKRLFRRYTVEAGWVLMAAMRERWLSRGETA